MCDLSLGGMTCMRCFCECIWGTPDPGPVRLKDVQQQVVLDTNRMGVDCVIVKSGRRICGTGAALANAPLVQDKSYFEVKLQSAGVWGVGLATPLVRVDQVPLGGDAHSWVLTSERTTVHNAEAITRLKEKFSEGNTIVTPFICVLSANFHNPMVLILPTILDSFLHVDTKISTEGVSYDHVELNFFLNGKSLQCPVMGIRGMVYPVFYVDDSAILDVQFSDFSYPPPDGFDRIMFEKNIL